MGRWKRRTLFVALAISSAVLSLIVVAIMQLHPSSGPTSEQKRLRVLSYGAFLSSWGPGPDLARAFLQQYGVEVEFQNAGDAGLLLQKLSLFPADVVLGLDELSLAEARKSTSWFSLDRVLAREDREVVTKSMSDFLAFDWAPFGFVYRNGEIEPPHSLEDLLQDRFKKKIALEDPRTSSPGLAFFFWILDELGVDEGFRFLANLKPNVNSVSGGWSEAYGLFTGAGSGAAKLVFSYQTSPLYHRMVEHSDIYRSSVFASGQVQQIEFAGVPTTCERCAEAQEFLHFLLQPLSQKTLLEKNLMLPVRVSILSGRADAAELNRLSNLKVHQWKSLPALLAKRQELFSRWQQLGL